MTKINPEAYRSIVFFTGAGMSAESGVPTFRGKGGMWSQYRWEEVACQDAFDRDPKRVLEYHEMRRGMMLACKPHPGHDAIAAVEKNHPRVTVVTQNVDGMHQRAGTRNVVELHGSMWRVRCPVHGLRDETAEKFSAYQCEKCKNWLRPDIVWFGDMLDSAVTNRASEVIGKCDLLISIGTSGVVYPAAGFPSMAKRNGARCIEINPEENEMSHLYDEHFRGAAGEILPELFSAEN